MDAAGRAIRALRRWPAILSAKALAEWPLLIALAAGAFLRALAMLGFRPALWINDTFEYIGVALRWQAYPIRPDGYSAFLRVLLPFHSLALVAALQHVMGLAIGALIYAILRHWGVRRWLATVACLVFLLDVHQIQLEHMILSDTLFLFLLTVGLAVLVWRRRLSPWFSGISGLLIALSALTRTVGLPMLVIAGAYLLVRRVGWRPLAAFVAVAGVPLVAYAGWFDHEHGSIGVTNSDGILLYARVMSFADCSVIKPPKDLAVLCDSRPPGTRGVPTNFVWHASPLDRLPGPKNGETALPAERFSVLRNAKARQFAVDAILAQPGAMLRTTWDGFVMNFDWSRPSYPSKLYLQEDSFSSHPTPAPWGRVAIAGATVRQDVARYNGSASEPRVVAPYAGLLMTYQHVGFLPGTLLALLLVLGAAGCLAFRRRDERRWLILLLWTIAVVLLLLPVLTIQFDNRYVLPAVPFAILAAALALAGLVPSWSTIEATAVGADFVMVARSASRAEEIGAILGCTVAVVPRPGDYEHHVAHSSGNGSLTELARLRARSLADATDRPALADATRVYVEGMARVPTPPEGAASHSGHGAVSLAAPVAGAVAALDGRRRVRFRTVAAAAWPDGREVVAEATASGHLVGDPASPSGGYDAVFAPDEGGGRTMAHLAPDEQRSLSQRNHAYRLLAARLRKQ